MDKLTPDEWQELIGILNQQSKLIESLRQKPASFWQKIGNEIKEMFNNVHQSSGLTIFGLILGGLEIYHAWPNPDWERALALAGLGAFASSKSKPHPPIPKPVEDVAVDNVGVFIKKVQQKASSSPTTTTKPATVSDEDDGDLDERG